MSLDKEYRLKKLQKVYCETRQAQHNVNNKLQLILNKKLRQLLVEIVKVTNEIDT